MTWRVLDELVVLRKSSVLTGLTAHVRSDTLGSVHVCKNVSGWHGLIVFFNRPFSLMNSALVIPLSCCKLTAVCKPIFYYFLLWLAHQLPYPPQTVEIETWRATYSWASAKHIGAYLCFREHEQLTTPRGSFLRLNVDTNAYRLARAIHQCMEVPLVMFVSSSVIRTLTRSFKCLNKH